MSNIMDYKNMTNVPIYKFEESDIRIPHIVKTYNIFVLEHIKNRFARSGAQSVPKGSPKSCLSIEPIY